MPRPHNFGGKNSTFHSMSELLMPPDIAGINSVLTISSSCSSWVLMFGMVCIIYVGLRLNPVILNEYTVCGLYQTILHNIRDSVIH